MAPVVAALFVEPRGVYASMDGVELWPDDRDARTYSGAHPVVAHPPCARWSRLAGQVEARGGPKRGDDGGCFASALYAVRRYGGVLEHPQGSAAWREYGLARPSYGRWSLDTGGSWVTSVDQVNYGHRGLKPTWLYVSGGPRPAPMRHQTREPTHKVERMGHRERIATPVEFAEVLVKLAKSAQPWLGVEQLSLFDDSFDYSLDKSNEKQ